MNLDSILVAGLNSRPAALSAKKLGLKVYVVDYFSDVDLTRNVDTVYKIDGEYSARKIVEKAVEVADEIQVDGAILTSELGCNPTYIRDLERPYRIIGNNSKTVGKVRDWESFFNTLDELDIAHPKTVAAKNKEDVEHAFDDLKGPLLSKPVHGSGGFGIRFAPSVDDALIELERQGEILIQEYVEGVDASVSLLCSEGRADAISLNEQLIGRKEFGCKKQFGYCGNIVPLKHKLKKDCYRISEFLCERWSLTGSVGIDFVLGEKPYVIEVNPRIQDTLECIEKNMKTNLIKHHINACTGGYETPELAYHGFWCKGIMYADGDCAVSGNLTEVEDCVDVYAPGTRVRGGEPVCSVFGYGTRREGAFKKMRERILEVRKRLTNK